MMKIKRCQNVRRILLLKYQVNHRRLTLSQLDPMLVYNAPHVIGTKRFIHLPQSRRKEKVIFLLGFCTGLDRVADLKMIWSPL